VELFGRRVRLIQGRIAIMKLRMVCAAVIVLAAAGLVPAADQQLLGLLMPDAKVVAGLNVEQAKNSPFGQFLLSRIQSDDEGLQKLTTLTGFDPRRDLREVLMASVGQPGHKGLVVARGTFDAAKILDAARAAGHSSESYKGIEILTGKDDSLTHAVAFLDGSIAIAGDADSVKAAIDRRTKASSLDPALAVKVGQLSTSLDAWSVSIVPFAALAGQHVPDMRLNGMLNSDVLKSVQQTSGGVKFGAIIQLSVEAVARNEKDATALADVVRFLGSMVQSNAPNAGAAAITSLVQSLDVKADGSTVKVGLAIPEDQLENVLRSAEHKKRARI
jgi:hypothetical protein